MGKSQRDKGARGEREVISRKEAISLGLKKYFTGKPCKWGHISERWIGCACVECHIIQVKSLSARGYYKTPEYRARQLASRAAHEHRWPSRRKEYRQNNELKRRYGITLSERNDILKRQGDKCAVCGSKTPNSKQDWHVDHCHSTGKIRGVICPWCNHAIGSAKDNPIILRKLADYLETFHNG